jgi:hypothetical protein
MIKFDCKDFNGIKTKKWRGYISKLVYCGNHMEISIVLTKPITADVCKTSSGFFVYFPHLECGLNLSSLFDIDKNVDRLSEIFCEKDTFIVAYAIAKVGGMLSSSRRKRSTAKNVVDDDDDELPF